MDVYHTSTHGVVLVQILNACLKHEQGNSNDTGDNKYFTSTTNMVPVYHVIMK